MAKLKDHLGRPVVAVTGIGVVTSLGVGKADNWAALTAGKSGIALFGMFAAFQDEERATGAGNDTAAFRNGRCTRPFGPVHAHAGGRRLPD